MRSIDSRVGATLAIAIVLVAAGCESQRQLPPPAPVERVDGPSAVLPDGFVVELEIAANDELRAQGLMYRESLPAGQGMLFLFPQPGEYPFWMKNTLIPLDMIWLEPTGRIVAIRPDIQPCRADPCPTYAPESHLELCSRARRRRGEGPQSCRRRHNRAARSRRHPSKVTKSV